MENAMMWNLDILSWWLKKVIRNFGGWRLFWEKLRNLRNFSWQTDSLKKFLKKGNASLSQRDGRPCILPLLFAKFSELRDIYVDRNVISLIRAHEVYTILTISWFSVAQNLFVFCFSVLASFIWRNKIWFDWLIKRMLGTYTCDHSLFIPQ